VLQRGGGRAGQGLGDRGPVGERPAAVGAEHRVAAAGLLDDGIQGLGLLLGGAGLAQQPAELVLDAPLGAGVPDGQVLEPGDLGRDRGGLQQQRLAGGQRLDLSVGQALASTSSTSRATRRPVRIWAMKVAFRSRVCHM